MPFYELNLRPARVGRPSHIATVQQDILYPRGRPETDANNKNMDHVDLLKHVPSVKHNSFHSFRTNILNNEIPHDDHQWKL